MDDSAVRLQVVIEEQKKIREELDRKVFHFRTLHDTARELEGIIQPRKIMDGFLLMTIGSLGISRGLVALFNARAGDSHVVGRGFSQYDIERFKESLPQIHDRYFAQRDIPADSLPRVQIVKDSLHGHDLFPADTGTLILWSMEQDYSGIVGLGPKISGETQSEEDSYLLLNLTNILIGALSRAIFTMNIQQLNADLQKKNAVLEDALGEINTLNEGLVRKNEELRNTIIELTEAKHKIALLEKVRVHVRSIIQRELERSGRMNMLDIALLILMATVVGVLFNFANPHGIRILPEALLRPASAVVDVMEAKSLLDSGGAVLVDARPREFYGQKHIKGAINLPPALFDIVYMMKLAKVDPEKEIIVYGRSISKLYDEDVAYRLKQRDHEKVRVLSGELDVLETYGYQVEP